MMTGVEEPLLFGLIFLVAFLYSSVGHGGASGYLAILALFSFSPNEMRSSALFLNILVAGVAWVNYTSAGQFSWKLTWPFIATSIPAAFLGGNFSLALPLYKFLLAIGLLFAAWRLFGVNRTRILVNARPFSIAYAMFIGAVVGFISGGIGIGGGVFLSPLLLFTGWADLRKTAATSSLFILTNSLAALGGLTFSGQLASQTLTLSWVASAFAGGMIGSYLGASRIKEPRLAQLLACALVVASLKLLAGVV